MLIINIKELFGVRENAYFLKGKAMSVLPSIKNAYLQIEGETIVDYGEMKNIHHSSFIIQHSIIDATGKFLLPAWCDSHTHIVYAGSRENEFVDKIKGLTYEEIAQNGGGIFNKQSTPSVSDCLFDNNATCFDNKQTSNVVINRCVFTNNGSAIVNHGGSKIGRAHV